jgi:hypothetical protein
MIQVKNRRLATAYCSLILGGAQLALAIPAGTPEQTFKAFLWSASGSTEEKSELIYHDVKDNYTSRITFTRAKEFRRSDGVHGTWHIEGGKLILTGLDTKDGFTIIFDLPKSNETEIVGRIPKGKWRGHKVILKLPK